MKITVAGVVKEVKDNITISELIAQENVENTGIRNRFSK